MRIKKRYEIENWLWKPLRGEKFLIIRLQKINEKNDFKKKCIWKKVNCEQLSFDELR